MPEQFYHFWTWLFPLRRNRAVPWSAFELILAIFLIRLVWPLLVFGVLDAVGFFGWLYGPEFVQSLKHSVGTPDRDRADLHVQLWIGVSCFPLSVATIPLLCRWLSDTRLYQLGLTTSRLGRNALVGIVGALLVAPLHFVHEYLGRLYERITDIAPTQHGLTQVALQAPPIDQAVILFTAIVAAPVFEELLFRGFLQPWLTRHGKGSWAVLFAFVWALQAQQRQIDTAWKAGDWWLVGAALQPAAFVLLLSPALILTRRMPRPEVCEGIFGTALLFAAAHSSVWPSPVPLLPLGIVLGWLAYRTNSLVGPIVLHALFNSIACVKMFFLMSR
jgi:membrane protease YdiL (CAAX protease family)